MKVEVDVAGTVRRVLRDHQLEREPDDLGRAMRCSCGWWSPGTPWSVHLYGEFTAAGIDLGVCK